MRDELIALLLHEGCDEQSGYGHPDAASLADAILAWLEAREPVAPEPNVNQDAQGWQ